jgi:hypothetical protein
MTDAPAREDDDFANLVLQESTREALSVDARSLEVGARHRLGPVDPDPQALFVSLSSRWYSTDHRADMSVPSATRHAARDAAMSREGRFALSHLRLWVIGSDPRLCLSSAAILLLLQANPRPPLLPL